MGFKRITQIGFGFVIVLSLALGVSRPVLAAQPTITSLSPVQGTKVLHGAVITLSMVATGTNLEYRFLVDQTEVRGWTTSNSYNWDSSPESYGFVSVLGEVREAADPANAASQASGIYLFRQPIGPPALPPVLIPVDSGNVYVSHFSMYKGSIVDGNPGSHWIATRDAETWAYFDLGESRNLAQIKVWLSPTSGAHNYCIQVSNDALTWTDTAHVNKNSFELPWPTVLDLTGETARYVRLLMAAQSYPTPAVGEIEIWESQGVTAPPPPPPPPENELPSISSFVISDPDLSTNTHTNNTAVDVSISDTDADGTVVKWFLSESPSAPSVEDFVLTSSPTNFVLSNGDGAKTIYAWCLDDGGGISESVSATIILDTQSPGIPTVTVVSPTEASFQTLSGEKEVGALVEVLCANATVGVCVYPGGIAGDSWECTLSGLTIGANTVQVSQTDEAGNISATVVAEIERTVSSGGETMMIFLTAAEVSVSHFAMYKGSIVDGNPGSNWIATRNAETWAHFDLGESRNLAQIKVWLSSSSYSVQVSDDALNWTDTAHVNMDSNALPLPTVLDLTGETARYVRLLMAPQPYPTPAVGEIEIWEGAGGDPLPPPPPGNTPPSVTSLSVTDSDSASAAYTNSPTVAVSIADSDSDGMVVKWHLSENSNTPTAGEFVLTSRPTNYELSSGDGVKTVYAWCLDDEDAVSISASATIILDTQDPDMPSVLVTSPTEQDSQTISGAKEAGATVDVQCATATVGAVTYPLGIGNTSWECVLSEINIGVNAVEVVQTDEAGNSSASVNAAIERTEPTGGGAVKFPLTTSNVYVSHYSTYRDNIVDDNPYSHWISAKNAEVWAYFDLGQVRDLAHITIWLSPTKGAHNYRIQVSNDAVSWADTQHVNQDSYSQPWPVSLDLTGESARFVRLLVAAEPYYAPAVGEIQIWEVQ